MYPILATAVMAGLGFVFWLFSARLFSNEDVGLAGALISVMGMISTLSLLGFDTATVRFLANDRDKNASLNTGLLVVGGASLLLSLGFVLLVGFISPQLTFIAADPYTIFAFVIFCAMASINMFTDAVFLAYRETRFTFIIDTLFSLAKVALPFAFITWGALGIFTAAALAQAVGSILSIGILIRRFNYRPSLHIDLSVLKRVWKYSASNYIADAVNFLPAAMLPIIITNRMGADDAAHYYIVMLVVGFLFVIPASTMRSLFAEGSHDDSSIPVHVRGALKTTLLLLLPAMGALFVLGNPVLALFGGTYATSGISLLYIMTLVSLAVGAYALFGSMFRLTHNISGLIVRNATYGFSTITLTYLFLPIGLIGMGLAYAGGYSIATLVSYVLFQRHARIHHPVLAKRLSVAHLSHTLILMYKEHVWWPLKTMCNCKCAYARRRLRKESAPVTLLCYPDKPKTHHTLYKIAHRAGWKITNNPRAHAQVYMHFEDATFRGPNPTLDSLARDHHVLNVKCLDISKKRVDEVFEQVFGYPLAVDPTTYEGRCVRKSNINAVHDGKIITCPTTPEEGYVYQKHIDTERPDGRYMDIRVPVMGSNIPFALKRYKGHSDMFDITIGAELFATRDVFHDDEVSKVLEFCKVMGLDYGELDVLRDNHDGRIYIVDVNNTPSGPIGPLYNDKGSLARWYTLLTTTLIAEFQPKNPSA